MFILIFAFRLFGGGSGKFTVWDVQTGVVIEDFNLVLGVDMTQHERTLEFSEVVHTFLEGIIPNARALHEGCRMQHTLDLGPHWTHEGCLYYATSLTSGHKLEINIQKFHPTPIPSHTVVGLFHIPYHAGKFSFSPVSFHASFVTSKEVIILDVRDQKILLDTKAIKKSYHPSGLFSPDGSFFACEMLMCGISVWKCTPICYIHWNIVQPRLSCEGFSFSPTTASILTWGKGGIQLLSLSNFGSPSPLTKTTESNLDHLVTSSVDGTWIATARQGGHTITILGSLTGTPQHVINTQSGIQQMKFVHNAILVFSGNQLAKWNLESDGKVKGGVNPEVLTQIVPMGIHTLSNDGALLASFKQRLFMYEINSHKIISSCEVRRACIGADVEGVQFSPCQSKLWFWSVEYNNNPGYSFLLAGCFTQVELQRGHFVNSTVHKPVDEWSLLALLHSSDGFHIGHGGQWVEDSRGRKLFWLPPNWRVRRIDKLIWSGNLLALVDGHHEKPIIIQFQP